MQDHEIPEPFGALVDLAREVAECSTTRETPGVAIDDTWDEIVGQARVALAALRAAPPPESDLRAAEKVSDKDAPPAGAVEAARRAFYKSAIYYCACRVIDQSPSGIDPDAMNVADQDMGTAYLNVLAAERAAGEVEEALARWRMAKGALSLIGNMEDRDLILALDAAAERAAGGGKEGADA